MKQLDAFALAPEVTDGGEVVTMCGMKMRISEAESVRLRRFIKDHIAKHGTTHGIIQRMIDTGDANS